MWYAYSTIATILTAGMWCLTAVLIAGIGRIISHQKTASVGKIADHFIVGICSISLIGIVCRFIIPIDWRLRILLLLPALCGSILVGHELCGRFTFSFNFSHCFVCLKNSLSSKRWYSILIVLLVCFFFWRTANDATSYIPIIDGYHFTSIRWAQSYPYVCGLANLEGRLGFNNSTANLQAIFILNNYSTLWFSLLNGSIYVVLLGSIAVSGWHLSQKNGETNGSCIAGLWLLVPIVIPTFFHRDFYAVGGVSPDTTVSLCLWGLAAKIVSLETSSSENHFRNLSHSFLNNNFLVMGAAFGALISMKLSVGFYIIPFSFFFIIHYSRGLSAFRISGLLLSVLLGSSLLIGSWMVSNIAQSGWVIYPVPLTYLPLDWSVPKATGEWEHRLIRDYAMTHGTMSFSKDGSWVRNWIRQITTQNHVVFSVPFIVLLFFYIKIQLSRTPLKRSYHSIFVVTTISFIFSFFCWFLSAPAPRFFVGPIFASLIIFGFLYSTRIKRTTAIKVVLIFVLLMLISTVTVRVEKEIQRRGGAMQRSLTSLIIMPPPSPTGRYQFPKKRGETRTTRTGLKVFKVNAGPWYSPLLSNTRQNPDFEYLQERVPGKIQHGFRIASPPK